jgi:hypothetical protein
MCHLPQAGFEGDEGRCWTKIMSSNVTVMGVMVWAGLHNDEKTDLVIGPDKNVTAQRYCDEIIEPVVVP